jgi:hypothetical protein
MHQVLLHEDDERPRRPSEPAPAREPVFMSLPAAGGSEEAMWIEPPRTNAAVEAARRPARAPATARNGTRWMAALAVLAVAGSLAWYAQDKAPWGEWIALWGADDVRPAAGSPSRQAAVLAEAPRVAEAAPPVDVPPAAQPQQQPAPAVTATAAPADTPPATAADVAASLDKPPAAGTSSDSPPPPSRSGGGRVTEEAVVSTPAAGKAADGPAPGAKSQVERRPAAQARGNGAQRAPAAAALNPEALPATAAGPATPRATCGSRTNFALVYCMQTQCKRPGFAKHAQCVAFLRDGEVQ